MRSFVDDLKYEWNKPNNTVIRIILINVIVFIVVSLVGLFGRFGTFMMEVQNLTNYLVVLRPNAFDALMTPWTLLTYGFTHKGFLHILMNMLMLYWFGKFVGDYIGSQRLLGLYLWGVIAGGLLYLLAYNTVFVGYQNYTTGLIGASAGVYAILVGGATLLPEMRVHLLLIGAVKLKYVAAVSVFLSILAIGLENTGGNLAHLGGALMGFVFIKQFQKGRDWSVIFVKIGNFFSNLFKRRRPKMRAKSYAHHSSQSQSQKNSPSAVVPNQEIIDRILDKISESGYESLTQEEKQVLFRASQK
ncbi:rhomboid family intramembrane serine protease [Hugenholtzia roseola]|uniref:rhomboid family intramembrane serine protease n=1 Tax=Hugenholtzia roseola TaxID=1002 RepID=UPI0003F5B935|nr:rhomboid family intramembrane serine protease [Hugenholtzia roseola]